MGLLGHDGSRPGAAGPEAYTTLPIVRRSVLRFALSFPEVPADTAFVAEQRKTDPQGSRRRRRLLKLEQGK